MQIDEDVIHSFMFTKYYLICKYLPINLFIVPIHPSRDQKIIYSKALFVEKLVQHDLF